MHIISTLLYICIGFLIVQGERYFHISPMTDFMSQDASRYFDSQRVRKSIICIDISFR